jgi:8-hydroxy-5-deazaflavin:NADPH oxidoreductase
MSKFAVLGTGMVGKTIGNKLVELGHKVMMGSRTHNNEKAAEWVAKHSHGNALQGTFEDASRFGDYIFNCTKGMMALEILDSANVENLNGKILIDITNPLDFTNGFPPTLTVSNSNSLGEQIQAKFPEVKVVKALNTMNCNIMVNPKLVNQGDHDTFICGNDEHARKWVTELLTQFGWEAKHIIDLGDISNSRGTEQLLPMWVRLMGAVGSPMFQFKIVQ